MRNWAALSGSAAVLAVMLLAGAVRTEALAGVGQQVPSGLGSPAPPTRVDPMLPDTGRTDPFTGKLAAQQARALRDDRHKHLVEDTERLVQLSNELKAEVDKASKEDLSLAVIKKAGDIEKLAHDVKERMKN